MSNDLPSNLYRVEQVRQAEVEACLGKDNGLYELVEKAGQAAFEVIFPLSKTDSPICILVGNGNNGADGLVVARKLLEQKLPVCVMAVDKAVSTAEHQQARTAFEARGGQVDNIDYERLSDFDLIIDALFGVGLSRPLDSDDTLLVEKVNRSGAKVISLDVPSGVNADTGNAVTAIKANTTIVFGALKVGLCTHQARHYCGEIFFADIGFADFLPETHIKRVDALMLNKVLGKRQRHAHKGDSGKVVVIGGDIGMPGAVTLCAEASYRAGSGLVAVVSRPEHQAVVIVRRPELMFSGAEFIDMDIYHRLGWADVLVLGPGLGRHDWGVNLFKAAMMTDKPIVVDADGLNILSRRPQKQNNWILTPHSGEAARLLECDVEMVNQNRFEAAKQLHGKYGGVIVLKGAGTIITDGTETYVATIGNPGLASGGCGDVLAGIIGSLLAQGLSLLNAATIGVVVHGYAGDRVALSGGERGMLAGDLMVEIRRAVNL
ncbi:bifunctional ADP-dependent NAD(P)H-hydrate dehydratase/NAD(P)H-hydrate epimerase [Shewanella sp. OPT22]|nr:bifunctional ADP-dependent NAD(P)H-hydrate dehydratase/NAD(P)H-hydrate epimerase [Shewanella sp. OPT22]